MRTQHLDGRRGHMGARREILDGDEPSVPPRLDNRLCRLLSHARDRRKGRQKGVFMQDEFLRIGGIEIDRLTGEAAQVHLPCELQDNERVLLLVVQLAAVLTRLSEERVDCRTHGILALRDDVRIELCGADGEVGGVVCEWIVHLAERNTVAHHDIRGRMGAREEVFDLLAGLDVPLGDPARAQFLHDIGRDTSALSHILHRLERQQRLDAVLHEVVHDVVTRGDRVLQRTRARLDEILCVAEPDVRPMGKARNPHEIGKAVGV